MRRWAMSSALGRAVDDHIDAVGPATDHEIVENPAILREQQRIAHLPERQPLYVGGQQGLERLVRRPSPRSARSAPYALTSNSPADSAHPQMLGHDAFILDGHVIAGKLYHAAAACAVPRVERQRLDLDFGAVDFAQCQSPSQANSGRPAAPGSRPPVIAAPSVTGT